jgi:hypothetical protein
MIFLTSTSVAHTEIPSGFCWDKVEDRTLCTPIFPIPNQEILPHLAGAGISQTVVLRGKMVEVILNEIRLSQGDLTLCLPRAFAPRDLYANMNLEVSIPRKISLKRSTH